MCASVRFSVTKEFVQRFLSTVHFLSHNLPELLYLMFLRLSAGYYTVVVCILYVDTCLLLPSSLRKPNMLLGISIY